MDDKRTITVENSFGRPREITKREFVSRWVAHASQLVDIGMNVMDEAREAAGARFEDLYAKDNANETP